MTNITTAILIHRGKHPDRLTMHPGTVSAMLQEQEWLRFMGHIAQWRDDQMRVLFYKTPIREDRTIAHNIVIFEQGDDHCGYQETHRITVEGIEP